MTTLIISNEEMKGTMEQVKYLGESGLLNYIEGVYWEISYHVKLKYLDEE